MAEIVGSLFGVSPEQLMQQRQARDYEQQMLAGRASAVPGSMMSPSLAPFYQQATQQGQLIGRGVGALLGAEDPELQRITQIKQLSSQFDLSSPEGMRQFAGALQQIAPNEAMMAAKRADEMAQSGLTRQKTQADITLQERKVSQDEELRKALAQLPENATDAQYLQVFRQFGSPDQQASALERARTGRERIEDAKLRRAEIAAGKVDKIKDKDLPAGTVKEIATAERINNTLNRTNTTLDKYITDVDANTIEFNLGKNIAGWVQRGTGKQDANTLKQVSLAKFLENERNAILLAAKGTQTEGDATRAMSQIFGKTDWTSNVAVSQALSDLKEYKNSQIDSNNVFMTSLRGGGLPAASTEAPKTPPTTPRGKDYSADYAKYQAKYKEKAVSYDAYVATRTGK